MISDRHRCIFTHVPKTAGRAILASFGLPLRAAEYDGSINYIRHPFGHKPLASYAALPEFAYFKFAFVRNPWDRLVSTFAYLDVGGINEHDRAFQATYLAHYGGSFARFVAGLGRHVHAFYFRPQIDWFSGADGRLLADFVGRYERLDADFAAIAERLAIEPRLPRLNQSSHRPYREYYDASARRVVADLYRSDIESFGYEF